MGKQNVYVQSFNVGVVDRKKLVRVDLERMRLAAEDQTNLMCTVAGNMFFRPGLGFIGGPKDYASANICEFVKSADEAALLEFTPFNMRVYVDDEVISRPGVATNVNNGEFAATGAWVLTASDGATSAISSDALRLRATARGSKATAIQEVSVAPADRDVEHALAIHVDTGPVTFRCGSTSGNDQYISETELASGYHSLSFTPTGASFFVFFQSAEERTNKIVKSCQIDDGGVMNVQTPWGAGAVNRLRRAQSADVIFVASGGEQYKVERRGDRSWSVVKYISNYGPFTIDRTAPVRLKPAATEGNTTLTASDNFFTPDHVGAIFRLFHNGQSITQVLAGEQIFTDPIKVTGVDSGTANTNDRDWTYTTTGTWAGTLVVQRSFDSATYGFKDYRNSSSDDTVGFTSNVTDKLEYDSDDNAIVYYRLGFEDLYTSGAATVAITYDGGGDYGICRVTGYNSKQSVDIEVIKPFKGTTYTEDWREGMWSDNRSWATAVCLSEGRLFWLGDDKFWGSVSDGYDDFDETTEGDSGPISRSIAIGAVNVVQWALPLQRVVVGANGAEISAKSSSLDEPLTPTAFSLKSATSIGSADVDAVRIDGRGVFVSRNARALYELVFDGGSGDYQVADITQLCSTWFSSGIVDLAVSRLPDTRIWVILANGDCVCVVYEPDQKVIAFVPIATAGNFERVCVLPGVEQDGVYFIVKRTINSNVRRYIEKMALDSEAFPQDVAKVMDSFSTGTNDPASATISDMGHLRGRDVKVWADGVPLTETVGGYTTPKLFTVATDGTITLDRTVTNWCVGLPYQGVYKSARLAYGAAGGTAMLQSQSISTIGLIMSDVVRSGIRYGGYLDNIYQPLMPLPALRDGVVPDDVSSDTVLQEHSITFNGGWTRDSRICITVDQPANFLGMEFEITTNG